MSGSDWASIIVSLVTLLGVIITAVLNHRKIDAKISDGFEQQTLELKRQSEIADTRLEAKLDKNIAVTETKLDALTVEVRKHNNFAEKIPVITEQIRSLRDRVDLIERDNAR